MPRFDLHFAAQAQIASEIVIAGETARVRGRNEWTAKRLEFLYELAYLRVFASWEAMLEATFYRSLCGFASRAAGQETIAGGAPYYRSILAAETAVLAAESRPGMIRTYTLWHSPAQVIARCKRHITPRPLPAVSALQETTIASNRTRLEDFAAVRHRIVHDQQDAKTKFDAAALSIAGDTYPASRPGKFLRDIEPNSAPPRKWIDVAIAELTGLAGQMV